MLRNFFADHLPRIRGVSRHTIHSYRDSLKLLLRHIASRQERSVVQLDLRDIEADDVLAFLDHLERERGNTVATRNVRLAALHSFFRYVAGNDPQQLERSQRILAIPFKLHPQRPIDYLEYDEIRSVLATVERSTRNGLRDYALLATMFNTGGRVQELLDVRAHDLQLVKPYQIRLFGKGQKERLCPLWPQTAQVLWDLCAEFQLDLRAAVPVFLNHRGRPLTRFGVRYILAKYLQRAIATTPTLAKKRLHPHSMRHSTAIYLLKSNVDLSTISHWLGHTSINTTNKYAIVDLDMKRHALTQVEPIEKECTTPAGWRHNATILEWLESL
jgi:site-specific recombinase XerD